MKTLAFTRFKALDYACTEALNTLCTNLSFSGSEQKKIMITSCQSSEGKTFLSMHMLRTLAGLGRRVVLVDADLRRSMVGSRFGIRFGEQEENGLVHYLAGMCSIDDSVYATNIENAYLVPVGRTVTNSLSLLSTPRLGVLLEHLAKSFDLVLVDAPPIGLIIDAAEIAKSCDGTLLVVSYNRVNRRELADAANQIERSGCKVLGAVLNNVTFDTYSSKRYYNKTYYTHYGIDPKSVQRKKSNPSPSERAAEPK